MAEGINPATWMLEISTISMEEKVGVEYATAFAHSDLYRWALLLLFPPPAHDPLSEDSKPRQPGHCLLSHLHSPGLSASPPPF